MFNQQKSWPKNDRRQRSFVVLFFRRKCTNLLYELKMKGKHMNYTIGTEVYAQGRKLIYIGNFGRNEQLFVQKNMTDKSFMLPDSVEKKVVGYNIEIHNKVCEINVMKKGQIFISTDGTRCILVKRNSAKIVYKHKDKIINYHIGFISEVLEEYDNDTRYEVVNTKKDVRALSLSDKVMIGVHTLFSKEEAKLVKNLKVGPFVQGCVHNNKENKNYEIEGVLLKYEIRENIKDIYQPKVLCIPYAIFEKNTSSKIMFESKYTNYFCEALIDRLISEESSSLLINSFLSSEEEMKRIRKLRYINDKKQHSYIA